MNELPSLSLGRALFQLVDLQHRWAWRCCEWCLIVASVEVVGIAFEWPRVLLDIALCHFFSFAGLGIGFALSAWHAKRLLEPSGQNKEPQ